MINNFTKMISVALLVLIVFSYTSVNARSAVKVTIVVVDEDGSPVEAAKVGAGFRVQSISDSKSIPVYGNTDSQGLFTTSVNADSHVGFTVKKEGYYISTGEYTFKEEKYGRWEPWNPVIQVVLRKIINPVPMYARSTWESIIKIPVINKEVGFDLMEFDWVVPYGKGKKADFIFKLERRYANEKDFDSTLTVTFSNRFDGMQVIKQNRSYGSQLKLARLAPDDGYKQKFVFKKNWLPGKPIEETYDDDNNYYFRVRSEEKNGKLVRAMYGKIIGDIRFDPRDGKTAGIYFSYYLNPDHTKNLEFSGQNLFTNLKEREQVVIQ